MFSQAWFCNSLYWSFGKYWFTTLFRSSNVNTFLSICQSHLLITTASLIRKVSVSKVFNFCLKAHILLLATNAVVFLPITGSLFRFWGNILPNMQIWIANLSFFQVQILFHLGKKKKVDYLASNSNSCTSPNTSPPDTVVVLLCVTEVLYAFFSFCLRVFTRYVLKDCDFIKF